MILTCRHTPRFCGQACRAGCFGLRYCWTRGLRTSWLIVGMNRSLQTAHGNGLWTAARAARFATPEDVTVLPAAGLVKGLFRLCRPRPRRVRDIRMTGE